MKARFSNRRLEQRIWDATERHIKDKYWSKIEPDDVVFDIGADFGAYAIPAALNGATVYAFEPRIDGARELAENAYLNGLLINDKIHIVQAAVMEGEGKVKIGPPDSRFHLGDQERATTKALWHLPESRTMREANWVRCTSIDDFVKEEGIKKVDWIKMDIEGAEMDALRGGLETIRKFKPNLIIECHENYNPIIEFQVDTFVSWLEHSYTGKKETDFVSDLFGLLGMRSFHYVFSVDPLFFS